MVVLATLVETAVDVLDSLWLLGKLVALEALVLALGPALLSFSSLGTDILVKLEVDEFLRILVAMLLSGEGTLAVVLKPFSPLFC